MIDSNGLILIVTYTVTLITMILIIGNDLVIMAHIYNDNG